MTTLYELKEKAGLREEPIDLNIALPKLDEGDNLILAQIRQDYHNLTRHGELREDVVIGTPPFNGGACDDRPAAVKMVILSPLLRLAGFYNGAFQILSEIGVELKLDNEISRGRVDLLIIKKAIWILSIETREILAARVALHQLVQYMLNGNQAQWGLVTNGYEFVLVRLLQNRLQLSYLLDLERPGDLETIAAVLKWIAIEAGGKSVNNEQTTVNRRRETKS